MLEGPGLVRWSLVLAPGLLLTVAVCAVLNGNGLLLSEASEPFLGKL